MVVIRVKVASSLGAPGRVSGAALRIWGSGLDLTGLLGFLMCGAPWRCCPNPDHKDCTQPQLHYPGPSIHIDPAYALLFGTIYPCFSPG